MYDLSIIIVNYNVKEFLLNSLSSIYKALGNINAEIIVVDNASDDGSMELVEEKYPSVIQIKNKKNVGFGSANNQALEIANGKYILLLNPDTIVREDTFEKMIRFFEENPDAGMAGCKVLNPDGSLQLACRRGFPGPWTSFTKVAGLSTLFPKSKIFAKYNLTYLNENETYEVDAVSGAFMMLRKETYDKIGGFDPKFFMYGEDLDLCYRTQNAGFKVYYVHETEIIHYKGESTKRSSIDETKIFYEAMHLFVKKHFSASIIVESILRFAIFIRTILAFINLYKLPIASAAIDFIFFSGAILAAEKIHAAEKITWEGFPPYAVPYVYFVPSLFQLLISSLTNSYKKNSLSVLRIILSLLYCLLLLSSLTFFFKQFAFSRAVILITYLLVLVAFPLWRILVKVFFRIGLVSDTKKRKTLLVGNENKLIGLAGKLKKNINTLYEVIGFISKSRKDVGRKVSSYEYLGTLENIKKIISEKKIDLVIFSTEEISFTQMFSIVSECGGLKVEFLVSGSDLDYVVGKSAITMLDDIPLLKIEYNISSLFHVFSKRMFDLIMGVIVLLSIYPFIYLFSLFKREKGNLYNFIIKVPLIVTGLYSFVGPYSNSYYDGLFVGKKGLTGFWFIENLDTNDQDEIRKIDIYYAKNYNIWLDMEILGKTISKLFFRTEQ